MDKIKCMCSSSSNFLQTHLDSPPGDFIIRHECLKSLEERVLQQHNEKMSRKAAWRLYAAINGGIVYLCSRRQRFASRNSFFSCRRSRILHESGAGAALARRLKVIQKGVD